MLSLSVPPFLQVRPYPWLPGEAPKKNLYGWKPVKAYLLDPKELEESTLNERIPLKDPQNEEGEILITPKDEADPLIVEPAFHQMQNQPR